MFGGVFVIKKKSLGHGTDSANSCSFNQTTGALAVVGLWTNRGDITSVSVGGVTGTYNSGASNLTSLSITPGASTPVGSRAIIIGYSDSHTVTCTCSNGYPSLGGQTSQPSQGTGGGSPAALGASKDGIAIIKKAITGVEVTSDGMRLLVSGHNLNTNQNIVEWSVNGEKVSRVESESIPTEIVLLSLEGIPPLGTANRVSFMQPFQLEEFSFTRAVADSDSPSIDLSEPKDSTVGNESENLFVNVKVMDNKPDDSGVGGVGFISSSVDVLMPFSRELNAPTVKFSKHSPLTISLNLAAYGRLDVLTSSFSIIFSNAVGPEMSPISIPNTENGIFIIRLYDAEAVLVFEVKATIVDGKMTELESKNFPTDHPIFGAFGLAPGRGEEGVFRGAGVFTIDAEDNAGNKSSKSLVLREAVEEGEVVIEVEEVTEEEEEEIIDEFSDITFLLRQTESDLSFVLANATPDLGFYLLPRGEVSFEDIFDISIEDSSPPGEERIIEGGEPPFDIYFETEEDGGLDSIEVDIEELGPESSAVSEEAEPFEIIIEEEENPAKPFEIIIEDENPVDLIKVEIFELPAVVAPERQISERVSAPAQVALVSSPSVDNFPVAGFEEILPESGGIISTFGEIYEKILEWFELYRKRSVATYPAGHDVNVSSGWVSYKGGKANWPANHAVEYSKSWASAPMKKTFNWPANHHIAASNLGNFGR